MTLSYLPHLFSQKPLGLQGPACLTVTQQTHTRQHFCASRVPQPFLSPLPPPTRLQCVCECIPQFHSFQSILFPRAKQPPPHVANDPVEEDEAASKDWPGGWSNHAQIGRYILLQGRHMLQAGGSIRLACSVRTRLQLRPFFMAVICSKKH